MISLGQVCKCKPRILIVDDNEYNLMPLKFFVKEVKFDTKLIKKVVSGASNSIYRKKSHKSVLKYLPKEASSKKKPEVAEERKSMSDQSGYS